MPSTLKAVRTRTTAATVTALLAVAACSGSGEAGGTEHDETETSESTAEGASPSSPTTQSEAPNIERPGGDGPPLTETEDDLGSRCAAPDGVSNDPQTMRAAIELINALPKPVSIACLVQSLARPLRVFPTASPFSAQPAQGTSNPRVFIFSGEALILSVVPAGVGRDMLELSQLTSVSRSVKAEIPFPITENVTDAQITAHLEHNGGTVCALCHSTEIPIAGDEFFTGALESDALRPVPAFDVTLDTLRLAYEQCDDDQDPIRCEILDALFEPGELVYQAFPEEMRTFY